jgi:hypothetical protein
MEHMKQIRFIYEMKWANDHHGAILICLEANARYAYGRPLTMKADAKKRGFSAEKTTKAFKSILQENHNHQKKGIPPILHPSPIADCAESWRARWQPRPGAGPRAG